jgi:dUTP pyrophosphatase
MEIHFVKTHKDAILPKRNYSDPLTGDAGFDIFSVEGVVIPAGQSAIVNVGIEVGHITPGYWFKIEGRSGLAFQKEVDPHFGIIDNGYRGEFQVKLFNSSAIDCTLPKGYAVAQMIVHRMVDCKVAWTEEFSPSDRGRNGFGSSDKVEEKSVKVEKTTEKPKEQPKKA